MSTLGFFITALAILSSPIEPRRWGHEIDAGVLTSDYIPGFIGERPITGPDGDYLRATFCYCKTAFSDVAPRSDPGMVPINDGNHDGQTAVPDLAPREGPDVPDGTHDGQMTAGGNGLQPGEIVQGHFWRYEYFNYHDNATYFLSHYCMEDAFPQDKYGCGYDAPGHFNPKPESSTQRMYGNDYALTYSPLPHHDLHSWTVYKKANDIDWIMYGRGPLLNQQKRRLGEDQGMIEMPKEYVDDTCSHYCDTELLLPMDPTIRSHEELYNDIDDMCDRCK